MDELINKFNLLKITKCCKICGGEYIQNKHNFDECYTYDCEYDIFEMDKYRIINLYNNNLRGQIYNKNETHHGRVGHWIEKGFDIKPNNNKKPDLLGFEIKHTGSKNSKISFIDRMASEYLFTINNTIGPYVDKSTFIKYFGTYKSSKDSISWSGKCFPTVHRWNECGQRIFVDDKLNIIIRYDYNLDTRLVKPDIKCDIIAIWRRSDLEQHINTKFNTRGFILVDIDKKHKCCKLLFGSKINFQMFIEWFKKGVVILDSGMKIGNNRCYSTFRAPKKLWLSLIISEHL